jgi:hypothetical protein
MLENPILCKRIYLGFYFAKWELGNLKGVDGTWFRFFMPLNKNAELGFPILIHRLTIQNNGTKYLQVMATKCLLC